MFPDTRAGTVGLALIMGNGTQVALSVASRGSPVSCEAAIDVWPGLTFFALCKWGDLRGRLGATCGDETTKAAG